MRRNMLVTASVLALFAAPALAQTTSLGTSTATRGAGTGTSPSTTPQASSKPDPLTQDDISQIKGAAVYGSDGKKVGSIATVLMKPGSRTVDRLVVGAGGLLGVGAREVVLPLDQFHWDAAKGGFKIAKTEDDLKKMPEWKAALGNGGAASGSSTLPQGGPRPGATPSKP
ncbi:MAG TPA: PRC-barrel domain-containing protein [Stellaceae bacterium]|nr:PRC-barrel domain-containing protein [Stellaceae bacterium]